MVTGCRAQNLKKKAAEYRKNSVAESTRKNRELQWQSYVRTCEMYNWPVLPCSLDQACWYVTHLAERLSYASVLAYYNAVVYMHACMGLEPVRVNNPILKATLEGIGRVKGKSQNGKDPILPHHLKKLSSVVDKGSIWEMLTFVCVLFLFRTLLRVSHVVWSEHTLLRSDLKFNHNGMLIRVRSSKTVRRGEGNTFLPVVRVEDSDICAVRWVKKFLKLNPKQDEEQLFAIGDKRFTYHMFSENFKKLLSKGGIVGDFASHSLRRGGATHMSMSGCTLAEVKQRGLWKSNCMFRYIRQPLSHKVKVEGKVTRCM